jgi:transglutaminase-like putative cysteine protease
MPASNAINQVQQVYSTAPMREDAGSTLPTITIEPLADGIEGTLATLDLMALTVRGGQGPDFSGFRDPAIQQTAQRTVRHQSTSHRIVEELFDFCRDRIRYVNHPFDLQVVQDAARTLDFESGDCVSKSVCLATLLACLDFLPRFVAQKFDATGYDHVYVEVWLDGQWIALDPTGDGRDGRPFAAMGWRRALPDYGCETTQDIF